MIAFPFFVKIYRSGIIPKPIYFAIMRATCLAF